jgi:hypothetical protein
VSKSKKQDLTPSITTEFEMITASLPKLTSRQYYSILMFLVLFISNCYWAYKITKRRFSLLKKKILGLTIVLFVALSIFYCGGGGNGTPGTPDIPETVISDPSFSGDIQPIFSNNCAVSGCHNSTAQAGLNLSQGLALANIVNVASTQDPSKMRILPADAANSYLVIKIEGNQTVGDRMPQGRSALSSVRIQNIKNWVDRGAKNN